MSTDTDFSFVWWACQNDTLMARAGAPCGTGLFCRDLSSWWVPAEPEWVTDDDRNRASAWCPGGGPPVPGPGACWCASWCGSARLSLRSPLLDMVFKFLIYRCDVWQSKRKKIKSKMQWQLTAVSSLGDSAVSPEDAWLLIRAAVWTQQNQIRCHLVPVISCWPGQGKVVRFLQLRKNCLKDDGSDEPPRSFQCFLNPDILKESAVREKQAFYGMKDHASFYFCVQMFVYTSLFAIGLC